MAACAAPPIALLLYLFIGQTLQEARFTDLELKGAAYIAEVWPAIMSGGALALPSSGPDAGEAGRRFHASDEEKAFLAAGERRKIPAGAALIQAVADGSNLTLDTDLGSFYAMDAATVALPRLVSALSTLDSVSGPQGAGVRAGPRPGVRGRRPAGSERDHSARLRRRRATGPGRMAEPSVGGLRRLEQPSGKSGAPRGADRRGGSRLAGRREPAGAIAQGQAGPALPTVSGQPGTGRPGPGADGGHHDRDDTRPWPPGCASCCGPWTA